MASEKRISASEVYVLPANGETAGDYTAQGRWNIGGWATYPVTHPLRDEPAVGAEQSLPRIPKDES